MKTLQQDKNKVYSKPTFDYIIQDEKNRIFFAASGTPGNTNFGINKMTNKSQDW